MAKFDLAVAIDAGSHSLKGMVLSVSKNTSGAPALPKILKKKFVKLPISYDPQLPADYQAKLASKLGEFILEMAKEGLKNSDRIIVGLGPSLADLAIEKKSFKVAGKEKVLTAESANTYFKNMGGSGGEIFLEVLANDYKIDLKEVNPVRTGAARPAEGSSTPPSAISILHRRQSRRRSNGVKVPESFGLTFGVMIPKLVHEVSVVVDETKKALGGLTFEFLPNAYLQQTALAGSFRTRDALAVDVGGENTQVLLLKNGSGVQTYSFPLGARHFIRGIAKIADLTYEEAEDIKKQYTRNIVDESRKKQIHGFLAEESKLWYKMFAESMDGFYHFGPLPQQVFMFGGGANLAEIADTVRKGDWMKNNSFADYPKVNILGGESVFEGDTFDGYIHGPEDFNLASIVFYLSR